MREENVNEVITKETEGSNTNKANVAVIPTLGELDPELAKEVISHYGEMTSFAGETINGYKEVANSLTADSSKQMDSFAGTCNKSIDFVAEIAHDANLSSDDKKECMEDVVEIVNAHKESIKHHDEELTKRWTTWGWVALGVVALGAAGLGTFGWYKYHKE